MGFIPCPTDKYMFKVNNKKQYIHLHVLKVKNKYSMTSYWCFNCWLWPQHISVSTFNFEQVFVSRVWKTSHNVVKTLFQGLFHLAIYHCTQLKQITTILSAYYDMNILWAYVSALNCCWNPKPIIIVSSRYLICYIIAISQRFNLFCCVKTKTYLNHSNSETNW